MPELRSFRGRKVKNAKKITIDKKPMVRITFYGARGKPGPQVDVTMEEYESVQRSFSTVAK